ncbi:hypothetical protein BJ508DRAFT_338053 [Ascobolus immersus RN42]|uniref:Uncharacterized protein n=1 Tax=Ascobolus immersus RN42 TaxID=1160509 RepID=A0A3N4HW44_ASCIM|nr:hypothetical protein BJ508DRAFT_338053 [Ascobolus immersus RN42]
MVSFDFIGNAPVIFVGLFAFMTGYDFVKALPEMVSKADLQGSRDADHFLDLLNAGNPPYDEIMPFVVCYKETIWNTPARDLLIDWFATQFILNKVPLLVLDPDEQTDTGRQRYLMPKNDTATDAILNKFLLEIPDSQFVKLASFNDQTLCANS